MKNLFFAVISILISLTAFSQPVNNACTSPTILPVNSTCSPTQGTLYQSTVTNKSGGCGNRFDVWYSFTTPASTKTIVITVAIAAGPSVLTTSNTFIGMMANSNCASSSSLGCSNIGAARRYSNLVPNTTYLFRVNTNLTNTTDSAASMYKFTVCVTSNDACENSVDLTPGAAPVAGSLVGSSASPSVPVGCALGNPDDDVWFKFTAIYPYASVVLTGIGSDLTTAVPAIQLLSGTCGSFSSVACGTTTINATGLNPGDTYYCRVFSRATSPQVGSNFGFSISVTPSPKTVVTGSRLKEVYLQQNLSTPQILSDPWEITYGPDNNLWVTESKGYKVYRINPITGTRDTVLDISQNSTFLPVADQGFNCAFANGSGAQGGCAGLALHPQFLDPVSPKNYIYLAYIHSKQSGNYFTNRVVRFTFNTSTNKLESPVSICDTLPGSNDHNSQRMIIAPVAGVPYLFYAQGDMGAGQFANTLRPQKAQDPDSYEGKILRFNLEPDTDTDDYEKWIPSTGSSDATNPFNLTLGKQSAVWVVGIRNNQGLAYDSVLDKLYGSSHGPFSDDEINVIERGRNYGHPLVIGYAADGNVNGTTAGASPYMSPAHPSSCPVITDELMNAMAIGSSYKDPLFSAYPNSPAYPNIGTIWNADPNPNNGLWPSEGWSGLGLYSKKLIPGWSKSLIASSLKWGRLVRIRLNTAGTSSINSLTTDTVSYFGSINRFRDIDFSPDGKDIYVVMDKSTSTSGPSAAFPVVPACQGCLQKYTFLGYADQAGKSTIPASIAVTRGTMNTCNISTTININTENNNYWVPITGPDGNILAEIYPNGQSLGEVTSSFYQNNGVIRMTGVNSYLDRNITITPQFQPGSAVKVRLYISKAEFDALDADPLSGVTTIGDLKILKTNESCLSAINAAATLITPQYAEAHGTDGYVLQADISGFSSFYFGTSALLLPVKSVVLSGIYKNAVANLSWQAKNETATASYDVERSLGNNVFKFIGSVNALQNGADKNNYRFNDVEAANAGATTLYYRLRITDKDGGISYSNTVVVELPGSMITNISVFPNPADKKTTVLINSYTEQPVKWQLVDITGRKVSGGESVLRKGENRINLDLQNLKAGTYFFRINGQNINAREKIQKL